jgi:cell division protein FtsZ
VKVVQENSFIEFKNEDINVPVLKSKEESQVDLFAGYFQSAPKVEEEKVEDANLIRHALNEEVSIDQEVELIEPSFDFEIKTEEVESEIEPTYELDEEDVPEYVFNPDENKTDESIEEQLRKSKERILRLKDLSMKLRTTNGLQELENEPAYKRKQMSLPDLPHSSESQVSRFTLSVDEGITEIKPNNSFLHDNVD